MKLQFNLNYHTSNGEQLRINLSAINGTKHDIAYDMISEDCNLWTCEIDIHTPTIGACLDYHYSVIGKEGITRHEWLVAPHHINLIVNGTDKYIVYDNWIDIPEDSYMYSSALTDCIAARKRSCPQIIKTNKGLLLKVRAPQLRRGERLAMVGNEDVLGQWQVAKAIDMTETQPNEWTVCIDVNTIRGKEFDFKFIILNENDSSSVIWEGGYNRHFEISTLTDKEAMVCELPEALFPIYAWKCAGTVIPVFSLRSEGSFGVGDFGDLKSMVTWVTKTRQKVLQILPVNDTIMSHTWTDCYPYKCISIYALHPQYTDFRQLPQLKDSKRRQYYEHLRKELNDLQQIDYERMSNAKLAYLRELYNQEGEKVLKSNDFNNFFNRSQEWLIPYTAFCYYRDKYGTAAFHEWPIAHQQISQEDYQQMGNPNSKLYNEVAFWYYIQYILDIQLKGVQEYAHSKQVILKGDIPIGVSRDSVEAWTEPNYFNMNGQAGAPPDAFSTNGQNWGFPTYNWDAMMQDGCLWWIKRFRTMAKYFDAYRIDHVLGFFRIWEIPIDAVHGLLGQFAPALALSSKEIEEYGIHFNEELFTQPYITDDILNSIFGEDANNIKKLYLDVCSDGFYKMKPQYDTQRKVEVAFRGKTSDKDIHTRDGLYSLISNVLFLHDHKNPQLFHPRVGVQSDFVYQALPENEKTAFNRLYNEFFYQRNNQFWYHEGLKKLELLTEATRMLVCAEDLGMVPECVPWVMNQLRILTLEIQTMPKEYGLRFSHLSHNPYRSVCTFSTHDMPTLRQWWDENEEQTQDYFCSRLHHNGTAPHPLPGWLAKEILARQLDSPSMLCLLSLQDWLSIDEQLRLKDANGERINIPANPHHYWRYRMHLNIEQLMKADKLNESIATLITDSGRR